MNRLSHSQSGSAHVVIIIILIVAIIGALGFVLWQNFLKPNSTSQAESTQQTETQTPSKDGTYTNTQYSFEYPKEGWTLKETEDVLNPGTFTPEVYTDDYAQTGMGLDSGALISVNANETTKTLDEEYAEIKKSAATFDLKDITKTTVNGEAAVTYNSEYEGPRYHTVFVKNGKMYDIVYQYAATADANKYMDAYKNITASFKFTN